MYNSQNFHELSVMENGKTGGKLSRKPNAPHPGENWDKGTFADTGKSRLPGEPLPQVGVQFPADFPEQVGKATAVGADQPYKLRMEPALTSSQ